MPFLPESTILGQLELLEVYEEYDGPRLFSCRNATGQKYIVIWVEEFLDRDIWYYAAVSDNRFKDIRSGNIDLCDVFLNAEDKQVYVVTTYHIEKKYSIERLTPDNLEKQNLPDPGERLYLQTAPIAIFDKISQIAISRKSDIIYLKMDIPSIRTLKAPIRILGNFLKLIQENIDAIGDALTRRDKQRGMIPSSQIEKTQLALTGIFLGSFGIELTSIRTADLFGNTPTREAIEYFISVIDSGCDPEKLKSRFHELNIRPASKYREFLQHLSKTDTSFNLTWASPIEYIGGFAQLSAKAAEKAIAVINEIEKEEPFEFEVVGILKGINIRIKNYEILEIEGNQKYSGRIADEAMPQADHATVNRKYLARIREVAEFVPTTGELKYKYQLMGLTPIDPVDKGK
jgi:hypothetical protein